MKIHPFRSAVLVLGVAVALAACGKKEEAPPPVVAPAPAPVVTAPTPPPAPESVSFAGLALGNAIGADQNVSTPMTTFSPNDTIYAAVTTKGAAANAASPASSATVKAAALKAGRPSARPSGITDFVPARRVSTVRLCAESTPKPPDSTPDDQDETPAPAPTRTPRR